MQVQSKSGFTLSACPAMGSRTEIESASRVGLGYASPDWTRRFIRGSAEDAKFEDSRDPSSTQPQMQDSGKPEDAKRQPPEGARSEETWRSISRRRRGVKIRGDPKTHRQAIPKDRSAGATRSFISGTAERMRNSRKLDDPSPARPEYAGTGATRSLIGRLKGTMHGPSNLRGQHN